MTFSVCHHPLKLFLNITLKNFHFNSAADPRPMMVGLGRIELPTSRLSGVRSNHLSYRPYGLPHCYPLPHAEEDTGEGDN